MSDETRICAGCSKEINLEIGSYLLRFRWGSVLLCGTDRHSNVPKEHRVSWIGGGAGVRPRTTCLTKYLLGPGGKTCCVCGADGTGEVTKEEPLAYLMHADNPWKPCRECLEKLARWEAMDADATAPTKNVSLSFPAGHAQLPEKQRVALGSALACAASMDGEDTAVETRPGKGYHAAVHVGPWSSSGAGLIVREDRVDAVRTLWTVITEALDDAFRRGHAQGRDLLFGLASGSLSTDQVNEASVKANNGGSS